MQAEVKDEEGNRICTVLDSGRNAVIHVSFQHIFRGGDYYYLLPVGIYIVLL